jgi:hypothetical protein
MKMPSNTKHSFNQIPRANIPRSTFNMSHSVKTMLDSDYIVPLDLMEIYPGDTVKWSPTIFARMTSALELPTMDNAYLNAYAFFVPHRLVWDNFDQFMGERRPNPGSSTSYTIPQVTAHASNGWTAGTIGDYYGIPIDIASLSTSALPLRGYNLIFNEWFRDQNLTNSVTVNLDAGPDAETDTVLLKKAKAHDYFTSCLPWPQVGDASTVGLSGDAPVSGIGMSSQSYTASALNAYQTDGTGATSFNPHATSWDSARGLVYREDSDNTGFPDIRADVSSITITVNALRQAFQLQRLAERDARGGTRYKELILSHFGVVSPDARQDRPELLYVNRTPLVIKQVEQTGETGTTPQGNLSAYATASQHGSGFTKSFTEHGYIHFFVCVTADISYMQGLERHWSRSTKSDMYWPALAHLGEQSVLNKEIYAQNDANDALVFGYQERYAELRYGVNKITGKLRSQFSTPLDSWHFAEEYSSLPTLSDSFIRSNASQGIQRAIAVTTEPEFVIDSYHRVQATRPLPVYGEPGYIDRF